MELHGVSGGPHMQMNLGYMDKGAYGLAGRGAHQFQPPTAQMPYKARLVPQDATAFSHADGLPRLNARQRRTLRRAKERATKDAPCVLTDTTHIVGTKAEGADAEEDAVISSDPEECSEVRPNSTKACEKAACSVGPSTLDASASSASALACPTDISDLIHALTVNAGDEERLVHVL